MNKGELVDNLVKDCDMSKSKADQVVSCIVDAITNALTTNEKVTLVGFGTFSVTERAAREGRNPQTGKTIQIAAKKVAKFKAGKLLDDAVN